MSSPATSTVRRDFGPDMGQARLHSCKLCGAHVYHGRLYNGHTVWLDPALHRAALVTDVGDDGTLAVMRSDALLEHEVVCRGPR